MRTGLAFRNVDASPDDPVETWPFEAVVAAVERGLARDPKTLPHQVRHQPATNGAAVIELLKVLLRMISEHHHVAAVRIRVPKTGE